MEIYALFCTRKKLINCKAIWKEIRGNELSHKMDAHAYMIFVIADNNDDDDAMHCLHGNWLKL